MPPLPHARQRAEHSFQILPVRILTLTREAGIIITPDLALGKQSAQGHATGRQESLQVFPFKAYANH